MLEKFRQTAKKEIERLEALEEKGLFPPPYSGGRPNMFEALDKAGPVAIIAEYKRASPSRGDIYVEAGPEDVARAYAGAGAAAVSVLTEREYFKGDPDFINRAAVAVDLPLLRKDFIHHPIQVRETACFPASAILLIARFADFETLASCYFEAENMGLEVVFEIFNENDLDTARALGARLVQVNSRNLDTLEVDQGVHDRLIQRKEAGELWIAASGIDNGARIRELVDAGYGAFLIGTSLMAGRDPGGALEKLISEAS